ncbi:M1 family metallopeptidase [Metaclostridioides mangenotii]|uniref:M1 family metallopeptidase n=1 Tax=Metaclostridioides mangenotii TaxID=1540 RepID=UPI001F461C53|nr:M1 family metallopeptidase [Clostridioides mangenotii]
MVIRMDQRVRKTLSVAAVFMLLVGGVIIEKTHTLETFKLNGPAKVNQYKIDAIFNDEDKKIMCNQTTEYVNNTKESLDKVYFHIYPNAFSKREYAPFEKEEMQQAYPNGFNEGYMDIKNVLSSKKNLQYEVKGEKNDILEIKLHKKLKPGDSVPIDFKYNVKLPNSLGRFGYGENTINVTNWYPIACVKDGRGWNLKSYESIGDPFYSETSDFDVNLLLPRKYKLANTGTIVNDKYDEKKKMYEIEAKNVRDFAFIMSEDFDIGRGRSKGVSINTYNLNKNLAHKSTEVAEDSIRIFSDLFGKYPYKGFSVVASDFYIGGMEYPMLVMIDQSLYNEKNKFLLEYVIAHEAAHQWWYSVVGNDEISEPWLDEALTEYSTVLYFENKYGKDTANKLMKTMEVQAKNYKSENIFKPTTDYDNSTDYSLNVYTKGAVALHKVREEVGDKVFFSTLKEYYSKNKYQNVNGRLFVDLWNSRGVDIDKIISECK